MDKVSKFEKYLNDVNLRMFEKTQDGEMVIFKSSYTFCNEQKVFIIIFDNSAYTQVLCRLARLDNPAKTEKMLYLLNELNAKYKQLKFIIDDEGNVDFSIDYVALDEDFNCQLFLAIVFSIFKNVESEYSKFMRITALFFP